MSATSTQPQKTSLYQVHVESGAKMVDFAGWDMPIEYAGIKKEHEAVRTSAGLFDLSHMGEIWFEGPGHLDFLQSLFSNDLNTIQSGRAQYGTMCNEAGHVLDDMIIYRDTDRALVVVNASNRGKMVEWMQKHLPEAGVKMSDKSLETALIAIQGPQSEALLLPHFQPSKGVALTDIPYYGFTWGKVFGHDCLVARTGYTGEDGFELYSSWEDGPAIWKSLAGLGIAPIGLGARDTLRLESGYALYGHELNETITPLDVALGWVVKLNKSFIGRDALEAHKASGTATTLVGIMMDGRAIPREGYSVFQGDRKVGTVTSGTFSPSLKKGVALARVESGVKAVGTALTVEIRDRHEAATISKPPFVKGSVKRA